MVDDPALAATLRPTLGDRCPCGRAFDDDSLRQIEALAEPERMLPGGARLSVHPTPALVAIDVDTGARRDAAAHMARCNRALLPALARQIRLRNLSGAILVDLAGLPARRRAALGPALAAALADDPLRRGCSASPRWGWPRSCVRACIRRCTSCSPGRTPPAWPRCAPSPRRSAADPRRCRRCAPPPPWSALRADPAALADLARRTGRTLILRSDPSLAGNR